MAVDVPVEYTPRVDLIFNLKLELVLIKNVSDTADVEVKALTKNLAGFLKSREVKAEMKKLDGLDEATKNLDELRMRRFM